VPTVDPSATTRVIDGVIDHYNQHRLHSSLNLFAAGGLLSWEPGTMLAERRRQVRPGVDEPG
jgi:hypothetical protein